MNTETQFDLLETVRRYISTATPEMVKQDILASNFAAYEGIGERITKDSLEQPLFVPSFVERIKHLASATL